MKVAAIRCQKCLLTWGFEGRRIHGITSWLYPRRSKASMQAKEGLVWTETVPRDWFGWFSIAMNAMGSHQSRGDHTLFIKHVGEKVTTLLVYVNDIVVTWNNEAEQECLKQNLAKEFEIKDLGVQIFLGDWSGIFKEGNLSITTKIYTRFTYETGLLGGKGTRIQWIPTWSCWKITMEIQ